MVDHDDYKHLRRIVDVVLVLEVLYHRLELLLEVAISWIRNSLGNDFASFHPELSLTLLQALNC